MDPSEEIKRLYFSATAKTIDQDFARAIDLLRAMPDEAARERLAVYMDGLAQMRTEARGSGGGGGEGKSRAGTPKGTGAKKGVAKNASAAKKTGKPRPR